jgi:YD repeat-containing protein
MRVTIGIAATLASLAGDAAAQQQTVYGPDGRATARIVTDSKGAVTVYGADGKVQERAATDRQGTTTIYDAAGRKIGTVTNRSK